MAAGCPLTVQRGRLAADAAHSHLVPQRRRQQAAAWLEKRRAQPTSPPQPQPQPQLQPAWLWQPCADAAPQPDHIAHGAVNVDTPVTHQCPSLSYRAKHHEEHLGFRHTVEWYSISVESSLSVYHTFTFTFTVTTSLVVLSE